MRKLTQRMKLLTRTEIANPNAGQSYFRKLKEVKAVDARRNQKVILSESGYVDIVPVDERKTF